MSRMKHGLDEELEAAANAILKSEFPHGPDGNGAHEWKRRGLLSPQAFEHRIYPVELHNKTGVADASIRRGQFSRPHNPRLGLRDTKPRAD